MKLRKTTTTNTELQNRISFLEPGIAGVSTKRPPDAMGVVPGVICARDWRPLPGGPKGGDS